MRTKNKLALMLICILSINACGLIPETDSTPVIIPFPTPEIKPGTVDLSENFSYTSSDGVHMRYKIEDTILAIGDTLKIHVDSENDTNPWVKLTIDSEEAFFTSDLPFEYMSVMETIGEYELAFAVSDEQEQCLFTLKTKVTVE